MIRLFVGLELPASVAEQLHEIRGRLPGARWIAPENLHLTLRFIGDVDEGVAADIDEGLTGIDAPAFELAVHGLGHFGKGNQARALWAGVDESEALRHLQRKVESAVVRHGALDPEGRKFKPHITLARLKNTDRRVVLNYISEMGLVRTAPFAVTAFTLFSSHLTKAGAQYAAERRYVLRGGRGMNTPPGVDLDSAEAVVHGAGSDDPAA